MLPKDPGWRKFPQAMANHRFNNLDGNVRLTIVNGNRQTDHFGGNLGISGPSFDGFRTPSLLGFKHFPH